MSVTSSSNIYKMKLIANIATMANKWETNAAAPPVPYNQTLYQKHYKEILNHLQNL